MFTTDTAAPLDTLLRVTTAEAVDITLRPAGMITRSRAYLVDMCIRLAWLYCTSQLILWLSLPLFFLGGWSLGLLYLNFFITFWLYPVFFEVLWHGQTPGKRLFGLQVCADNGAPITWSASLLRNLLRLMDALPFFYTVGIFVSLIHPQSKRLGDMLAGTLVVYVDKGKQQTDWSILADIEPIKPPVALTRDEQQAVLNFAERQERLPPLRREELAELGAHALYGESLPQPNALALMLGMAKFLLGDASGQTGGRP